MEHKQIDKVLAKHNGPVVKEVLVHYADSDPSE